MVKTILVADDSKTIQQAVNLTFRSTEFEVVGAGDGEEALKRLSEAKPAVILADITMPKKNGYELCGAVKSNASTAEIPVLLLAGPFDPLDETQAREAKADGHLAKPFETQVLIDRIKQLTSPEAMAALTAQRAAQAAAAAPPAQVPAPARTTEAPTARPTAAPAKAPAPAAVATAVAAKSAPALEPPPAPSEWAGGKTEVAPVDVWALADGSPAPSAAPAAPSAGSGVSAAASKAAAAMVDAAAEPIAELAAAQVSGLSKAELTRIARDVIEHIAWDVVPDLAETIIRAELKRLLAETHA
ncbi:MAG: response regulator [Deltaproteobacteria bacterium]|nr:response regulator [Deltaproteobacteria bacterium]